MKTSAFISYAHKKHRGFVGYLAEGLAVHVETFIDRHLEAGDWREQLQSQIKSKEFFLVVMSPEQTASEYCKWELEIALSEKDRDKIIPIRIDKDYSDSKLENLQYADF